MAQHLSSNQTGNSISTNEAFHRANSAPPATASHFLRQLTTSSTTTATTASRQQSGKKNKKKKKDQTTSEGNDASQDQLQQQQQLCRTPFLMDPRYYMHFYSTGNPNLPKPLLCGCFPNYHDGAQTPTATEPFKRSDDKDNGLAVSPLQHHTSRSPPTSPPSAGGATWSHNGNNDDAGVAEDTSAAQIRLLQTLCRDVEGIVARLPDATWDRAKEQLETDLERFSPHGGCKHATLSTPQKRKQRQQQQQQEDDRDVEEGDSGGNTHAVPPRVDASTSPVKEQARFDLYGLARRKLLEERAERARMANAACEGAASPLAAGAEESPHQRELSNGASQHATQRSPPNSPQQQQEHHQQQHHAATPAAGHSPLIFYQEQLCRIEERERDMEDQYKRRLSALQLRHDEQAQELASVRSDNMELRDKVRLLLAEKEHSQETHRRNIESFRQSEEMYKSKTLELGQSKSEVEVHLERARAEAFGLRERLKENKLYAKELEGKISYMRGDTSVNFSCALAKDLPVTSLREQLAQERLMRKQETDRLKESLAEHANKWSGMIREQKTEIERLQGELAAARQQHESGS